MKDTIGVSKEAYLEVNSQKNKYILMSRHNNAGQYHYKNIDQYFEKVAKFGFWGTT